MKSERAPLFDNAKFFLMLLVVLGHAMEITGDEGHAVYRLVYLFHMPAFALIAGFFSKKLKPGAIFTLAWQYALFQTLYCLFSTFLLGQKITLEKAFTTPYWILWFLFSLLAWKLLAPLVLRIRAHPLLIIALFTTLSLFSDLNRDIGYPFSLSRTLQFFPFFLMGAHTNASHIERLRKIPKWVAAAGFGVSLLWMAYGANFSYKILYGVFSFSRLRLPAGDGILLTLFLVFSSFLLIACFFILLPEKEYFFSGMGRRTLPCYLLHGFVMRALDAAGFGGGLSPAGKLVFYAASLGLALALMSAPVAAVMRPVLQPGRWLQKKRRASARF